MKSAYPFLLMLLFISQSVFAESANWIEGRDCLDCSMQCNIAPVDTTACTACRTRNHNLKIGKCINIDNSEKSKKVDDGFQIFTALEKNAGRIAAQKACLAL